MQYYLVERQSRGCDYTIGCGIRITQLNSPNMEAAMYAAKDEIGSSWRANNEGGIEKAEILEVSQVLDLSKFLDEKEAERNAQKRIKDQEDQRQADEATFEHLRKKLGR